MTKTNLLKLLDNLPSHYSKASTSNNYKIINALANQLTQFDQEKVNLVTTLFIDTAYGDDLDTLGALFALNRITGETDKLYRARIKLFWNTQVSSSTIDAIKNAVAVLDPNLDPENITVTEAPGKPFISVILIPLLASLTSLTQEIIDTVEDVKAAGVYVNTAFEFSDGFTESVTANDGGTATITEYDAGIFTMDVSWCSGPDRLG